MPSDADLLAAWRGGDQEAGNELAARYFDSLYGFFRNKVGDDIDDLLQKTMLACVEAGERFEGRSSFRTFLFAIARNVLFAHFRQRRRDEIVDFEHASVEDLGTSPSQLVARHQEARQLARALRRIPVDYQIALELYYWEQLTSAEIAEVLDVPHSTVRTRLRRGREAVQRELARLVDDGAAAQASVDELERWARTVDNDVAR